MCPVPQNLASVQTKNEMNEGEEESSDNSSSHCNETIGFIVYQTVDHLCRIEFGKLWSGHGLTLISDVTLTLSYSFRHERKELSYCGWSLLDIEALNK